ncbi:MAG: glycosyltransferase family 2 protein, partial [bacterium]
MHEKPNLSLVIPVYNEEGSLPELYRQLNAVLVDQSYEIIFVDDGSSDNSLKLIEELAQKDNKVKSISFSRNFGHMVALCAGLEHAQGEAVITLDADLQHPIQLIPELIKQWQAGAQVVNTVRKDEQGISIIKKVFTLIFYWLMNKIGGINLQANAADFRLLDKQVVVTLNAVKEKSKFLRGLISWVGYRQVSVPYQAEKRYAGKTKYSFGRMFSFALDGITSFSSFPLRMAAYLGLLIALFSFLYIIYALYIRFFTSQAIAGWTSVLVAVLFIGGVQLVFLGIIGEYLGRVFEETKQRP